MYVQEYEQGSLESNARRAYITYLDSAGGDRSALAHFPLIFTTHVSSPSERAHRVQYRRQHPHFSRHIIKKLRRRRRRPIRCRSWLQSYAQPSTHFHVVFPCVNACVSRVKGIWMLNPENTLEKHCHKVEQSMELFFFTFLASASYSLKLTLNQSSLEVLALIEYDAGSPFLSGAISYFPIIQKYARKWYDALAIFLIKWD